MTGLLLCGLVLSCAKEVGHTPYAFVVLEVQGEPVPWQETKGEWAPSTGTLVLQAEGHRFDRFRLHLSGIRDTGRIPLPHLRAFYYTDGLEVQPRGIASGFVRVTRLTDEVIEGTFSVALENSSNSTGDRRVEGHFGVWK
jgi:hypothetical protein